MISKTFKTWDLNAVQSRPRHTAGSYLTVYRSGNISFSVPAVDAMNLKAGEKITFFQGIESPLEVFIAKTKDSEAGIMLRKAKKNGRKLGFSGKAFATALMLELGIDDRVVRIRISNVAEAMPKASGLPPAVFRLYLNEVKQQKR